MRWFSEHLREMITENEKTSEIKEQLLVVEPEKEQVDEEMEEESKEAKDQEEKSRMKSILKK